MGVAGAVGAVTACEGAVGPLSGRSSIEMRNAMGGGAFGVDAAAQYYFNKSARDVNLSEAAMLAGLFKAPTRFAPHINLPAARARANVVLDNLVEANMKPSIGMMNAGARARPAPK